MPATAPHIGATAKSADTPQDFVRRLDEHDIIMPETADLAAYLLAHEQLATLLPGICLDARQALGPDVELSLEVYKDPEVDDRYLTLYARKERYEPDILERLQAVNERFCQRLEGVPGYFLLATDFSRPRGTHVV